MAEGKRGPLLDDVLTSARARAQLAEDSLARLAKSYSPEALFAAALTTMLMVPEGVPAELARGTVPAKAERLAFHLWHQPDPGSPTPDTDALNAALAAIEMLHSAALTLAAGSNAASDPVQDLLARVAMDVHTIRGSAYAPQTADEIKSIAGPFDPWFEARLGSPASGLVDAVLAIAATTERDLAEWMNRVVDDTRTRLGRPRSAQEKQAFSDAVLHVLASDSLSVAPVDRTRCRLQDGSTPSPEVWNTLTTLVGFTREHALRAADAVAARRRPLFVFADGRVMGASIPHILDCLWDALDAVARQDARFYDRFQAAKAAWLEERTVKCLTRVFGAPHVFKDLEYPDPDRPETGATAQLDAAVHWGPFLVLVEAKARQFRLEGQLGDVGRLRTDLKTNVADAFDQALRARRYLTSVKDAHFRELSGGRVLRVRAQDLRRIYLVTVSLHDLGNAISRLAALRGLGLFASAEYPWSVSLAVLDIITRFTEGPDVFLHYLERRREIEQGTLFPFNDDLDFFGVYLTTRLHPTAFRDGSGAPDWVLLSGAQISFDEWMEFERGRRDTPPRIELELPEQVRAILKELRARPDDDGARWIAFALLGLSNQELAVVSRAMDEARAQVPTPGTFRRLVVPLADLAFSVTIAVDRPVDELRRRSALRAAAEKYRRRVSRSIGFGISLQQRDRPFDCCVWIEGPWQLDPDMEDLLAHEPPFWPAPGQKRPGRNAPCFCGSGKKFKKCCLRRMETARADHW